MQCGNGTTTVLLECFVASSHSAEIWTRPFCVFVPNEMGKETSSQRGEGSFLLSSHTKRASQEKQRACLTHVAFIRNRLDIQPLLPQVIVRNETNFLSRDVAALLTAPPLNVLLVKQKSAWNNLMLMARIVTILALTIPRNLVKLQPILFLDASRVHLHAVVLNLS